MKRIINIIIDFTKTYKKSLVIFASVLMSLGVICGIFIYNNGVQNKKEKELLSRIDNLEEQIQKEDELSKDIQSEDDIIDSEEETSTNNVGNDNDGSNISQETNKENSNNNPAGNNINTGQNNNTTTTNTDTGSSTQKEDKVSVGGTTTDSAGSSGTIDRPIIGVSIGTPHYAYDVDLLPPTHNFSNYEITDYNYSDNKVYLNNDQFQKIEGTLSVTVKCTSDTPNIAVKYIVKDSSGSTITNGEYETLTAQSSGKGCVCTLTGIIYFPLTQEQETYSIEFVE